MTTTKQGEFIDIGDVIEATGVKASTLHVWERAGLIEVAQRNGLRRQYRPDVVTRIAVIVVSKRAGFSLDEIYELFSPEAFVGGKTLLTSKLDELRQRRDELDAAISGLEHAIACEERSPFECAGFQSTLPDVLPVA